MTIRAIDMSRIHQDAIDAIELALSTLGCSQKELALKLKVSPTQISKWKKGEYMSSEMKNVLESLLSRCAGHAMLLLVPTCVGHYL